MVGQPGEGRGTAWQWAMFDPVANAQALADVQAQALRAAGDLVERLAQSVDGARERASAEPENGSAPDGAATAAGDALRLVETWIDLLQRASSSFANVATRDSQSTDNGRVEVHLDSDAPAGGTVRLEMLDTGSGAHTEAWLHNGTTTGVGPLALHAGELRAPDGTLLGASVVCDPGRIDSLPGRSSRGVTVSVRRHGRVRAGTYRGLIQVEGAPDVWLAVEVIVRAPDGPRVSDSQAQ